jgi:hypothetical protein
MHGNRPLQTFYDAMPEESKFLEAMGKWRRIGLGMGAKGNRPNVLFVIGAKKR